VKVVLRGLIVVAIAAVVAQTGTAAPARMHLVTEQNAFVMWNVHDGLLGVGRCNGDRCVSGAVKRTSDGGRTYHVVLRTKDEVGFLQTVGPRGAIATTYDEKSWRTLDGGRTWQRVLSKPAVSWLNPRIGVRFRQHLVGNQLKLAMLATHDGGHSWQRLRSPCRGFSAALADLVTPKAWWVACLAPAGAGNEPKAIFRTRDGGATWQAGAAALAYPKLSGHGGIGMYGYPEGLAFVRNGWGLLTEGRGTLYVTRDGGTHFHAKPKLVRPEIDFGGGAAVFPGGRGYVLIKRQRLIETRNFGRTWHVVRLWRSY
jgi:photosystem II stability/assembly factor-like uncharacterized protein